MTTTNVIIRASARAGPPLVGIVEYAALGFDEPNHRPARHASATT